MATLTAVVAAIQDDLEELAGVIYVPASPVENINELQLPAMVVYAGNGYWRLGTAADGDGNATRTGAHTIMVDFHLAHDNLPLNVAEAMGYSDMIPNALLAGFIGDRFDGTVVTLGDPAQRGSPPIRYELTGMTWGGLKTVGWRIQIDVWVEEQITV